MSNLFSCSILQYHHSQLLGESLNVGMLFYFADEPHLYFTTGNINRVKAAYPNFDITLFNAVVRSIRSKLVFARQSHLVHESKTFLFKDYIFDNILAADAIALQFSEPVAAVNSFGSPREAIESYTRIFLPGSSMERPQRNPE